MTASTISLKSSLIFLLCFTKLSSAQCGSLVTYRQHADLLGSAPRCLREGCSQRESNTTISSSCPSAAPCSAYWNMFVDHFDPKHAWCSNCASDLACRIQGWPVMNATMLCQSTPNQILFGNEGCCTQGNEPFELASWTGTLCNGSEWRTQFDTCGGMACLDWREWIMPWNWTVQNTHLRPDQHVCKPPSRYLAIYAIEHLCWLVLSFGIGALRLWIARHEEDKNRSIFRFLLISTWAHFKFPENTNEVIKEKLLEEGEDLRPSFTDPLKWGFPVLMGVLLAGLQLAFNFWVAHVIKSAPGYDEVPLALLGLLFCCRPRLSWLSCLLALTPIHWLERIFHFKHDGDGIWAAKLVLSSVAVSSAVTESIMQLLGAYFLGTTAHIGRKRGFYALHHLRPKKWGRNARRMYLGALFWVMLCIPLVVVWFLIALFFGHRYYTVADWRRGIFNFLSINLNKQEKKIPTLIERPVKKFLDYINPDPRITNTSVSQFAEKQDLPTRYHAPDQPYRATPEDPFTDQPTQYNGPASGSLFNDLPMPVRYNSRPNRYSQLSQESEFTDQPMAAPPAASGSDRAASGGYMHSASAVQRRTPSGTKYNSLAQIDDTIDHVPSTDYASSPSINQRRTASGSQYNSLAQTDDMDTIEVIDDQPLAISGRSPLRNETLPSHHNASNSALLTAPASVASQPHPPSSSGNGSSNKRADYTHKLNLKWEVWEPKIIWAGAFLGMLAYAAQWVFWDGFVKAAGDRFCPPSIGQVSGIWGAGTVLCKWSHFYIQQC
jgi:hypothetical protein